MFKGAQGHPDETNNQARGCGRCRKLAPKQNTRLGNQYSLSVCERNGHSYRKPCLGKEVVFNLLSNGEFEGVRKHLLEDFFLLVRMAAIRFFLKMSQLCEEKYSAYFILIAI